MAGSTGTEGRAKLSTHHRTPIATNCPAPKIATASPAASPLSRQIPTRSAPSVPSPLPPPPTPLEISNPENAVGRPGGDARGTRVVSHPGRTPGNDDRRRGRLRRADPADPQGRREAARAGVAREATPSIRSTGGTPS